MFYLNPTENGLGTKNFIIFQRVVIAMSNSPQPEVMIGLEIHVELNTATKLFCGCATKPDDTGAYLPNTHVCPVCLGHPGSKPVLNKKALEYGIKLARALHCTLSPSVVFSRKVYFYPDLAKNYQITQYELPLGKDGYLQLSTGKKIGITRVHIEEDPAALVHPATISESSYVLIDYNRSGNPLVEIVTRPELELEEARDFMKQLLSALEYLHIFDTQQGSIKADANISIRESGYVRSEVKNITGFKEIESALQYEVERQKKAVQNHESFVQETRGWDAEHGHTFRLRTKETEEDYGYIIDPDLVSVPLSQSWVESLAKEVPELSYEKTERFVQHYHLSKEDASILAQDKMLADLFEHCAQKVQPQRTAHWIRRDVVKALNLHNITLSQSKLSPQHLTELLQLVEKNEITESVAKKILEQLVVKPFSPRDYVHQHNLARVSATLELEKWCTEALTENQQAVADYKAGEEKSLNFIVGIVMKKSKGTADPGKVKELLKKLINSKSI